METNARLPGGDSSPFCGDTDVTPLMRKTRLRLPTPCGLSVRRAPRSPPSPQPGPQGGDAMAPVLPALLCLGLIVGLRTQVQAGTLRKPTIWAEPGSVVTRGSPVTIWCQGPPNANSFSLNKEGTLAPWNAQPPVEPWDRASFFIKRVTEQQAGRYHCSHFIGVNWSEPSEPLELLVAGRLRDSPSLSVRPGPSVSPGETVTLLCQSGDRTDTFLLSKEGAAQRPLRLRSQDQDGRYQAEFSLSPVTSAHGGTYRCYRSLSTDPYLLSQSSEPLALVVSDYTVQNLTRMGLAASVLLLLGILLCQARHDRRGARDAARS